MKLPQKGFLLDLLARRQEAWDYELISHTLHEYGLSGRRGINTLRATLDELAAGGLIERVGEQLDDGTRLDPGKVLFRYRLTDFGRRRMQDTGLLPLPGG